MGREPACLDDRPVSPFSKYECFFIFNERIIRIRETMFGNLAEMAKLMSKAKDIQSNLKKFKEEMPDMEFSASSAGNLVRVTVSGDFRVKEITISEEALKDREELAGELVCAVNAAIAAAKATAQEKMNEVTGGLGVDLPGMF